MGEVENNCNVNSWMSDAEQEDNFCGKTRSISSLSEQHVNVLSEQQVLNLSDKELSQSQIFIKSRYPEKRRWTESAERADDDGFLTVMSGNKKRILRSLSKKSNNSNDDDNQNRSMEVKILVSVTSLEQLPKQFGMARLLKAENIQKILKITSKNPYRILIEFENIDEANKLIENSKFKELGYRCQMVNINSLSYGIIKNIEVEIEEKEIIENIECEKEVISVRRLKRRTNEGAWVNSEAVRICFNSPTLPMSIYMYGCPFKVEKYTFPVSQCSGCWKFGHLLRTCPTKKIMCPKCGDRHPNCETTHYTCINCKGQHMALDKKCPIFLKEKEIRRIMSSKNCPYRIALEMYLDNIKSKVRNERKEYFHKLEQTEKPLPDPSKKTYKEVLLTEALVHNEREEEEDQSTEIRMDTIQKCSEKNATNYSNKYTKKKKIEKRKKEEEDAECGEESVKVGFVKRFFVKIKEIILDDSNVPVKINSICKYIFSELKLYFLSLFKHNDVLVKVINYICNG